MDYNDIGDSILDSLNAQPSLQDNVNQFLMRASENSLISRGPLVFILMLLAMLGVTVNVIVVVVFLKRFPACALRTFIVSMAVVDFTTTAVGIPLHLYLVLQGYLLRTEYQCRIFYTLNGLTTNMSGFIVVLFAVDRVRRVKSPSFKEYDTKRSYHQIATVFGLSVIVTVPFIPLIGIRNQPLEGDQYTTLVGMMCWIKDEYVEGVYHWIYRAMLTVTFVLNLGILGSSYFSIGHNIHVLAKEFKEELLYRYLHPPVKRFPHFYDDDPPESMPVGETDGDIGFAAKLHGVHRPSPDVEGGLSPATGKVKKLSDAVDQIFHVDSPEHQAPSPDLKRSKSKNVGSPAPEDAPVSPSKVQLNPTATQAQDVPVSPRRSEGGVGTIFRSGWFTSFFSNSKKLEPETFTTKPTGEPVVQPAKEEGNINQSADTDIHEMLEVEMLELEKKAEAEGLLPKATKSVRMMPSVRSPPGKKVMPRTRKSTRTRVRGETMQTLNQLERIKRNSTKTMTLLTLAYFLTWLPYVVARVLQKKPINMCKDTEYCWLNWTAYAICSLYVNSTINPFLYCFGSVHFRKQCKLMIKPYQDRFCKERKRTRIKKPQSKKEKTIKEETAAPPPRLEDPKPVQAQVDAAPILPETPPPGSPLDLSEFSTPAASSSVPDSSVPDSTGSDKESVKKKKKKVAKKELTEDTSD